MPQGYAFTEAQVIEKKAKMISWLEDSVHGTFSEACEFVNISRAQGYIWRREDAAFNGEIERAREQAINSGLDKMESKLAEAVRNGNERMIEFYAKCLGRDRGYSPQIAAKETSPPQTLIQNNVQNNTFHMEAITDEQRAAGITALLDNARKRRARQIDGVASEVESITAAIAGPQ